MNISRILGLILLVIGVVCLGFGLNASHSFVDKLSEAATGSFRETTMGYIFGGIAMILAGGALFFFGRPKP